MLVKSITPKREKLRSTKTTDSNMNVVDGVDFFRVIPEEAVASYNTLQEAIDANLGEGIIFVSGNINALARKIKLITTQPEILKTLEKLYAQRENQA